jgi:hypothetical protein
VSCGRPLRYRIEWYLDVFHSDRGVVGQAVRWSSHMAYLPNRSIGASYLIRQSPGGERIGGLRVTIEPAAGNAGTIKHEATDWLNGQPLERPHDIGPLVSEAVRGIREVARQCNVLLDEFDVVLSHFLVHPVDSRAKCYYQAAKSAFRSALEAWTTEDLSRV